MKGVLLSVVIVGAWLLLALPCGATIAKVQIVPKSSGCSGTTCSVTVSAIGTSKHFGAIISDNNGGGNISISSVSGGGGTWNTSASCNQYDGVANDALSCAYNLGFTSADTTVTVTWSATCGSCIFLFIEWSYTGSSVSLDAISAADDTTSQTSQPGVTLTLTGTNDVVLQGLGNKDSTAITTYTNRTVATTANLADLENTTSGTAPTWTISSAARVPVNALAIAEASGGAAAPPTITLLGAGISSFLLVVLLSGLLHLSQERVILTSAPQKKLILLAGPKLNVEKPVPKYFN